MNAIAHRAETSVKPDVTAFFDATTNTISYVVKDPASAACAVVDSVMDIDYAAGRITHGSADAIIAHINAHGLTLEWLIETHVRDGVTEDEFVAMREARDATLGMPRLILPSLQVNMRAGALPPPDASGRVFLKLPVNVL